MGAQYLEIPPAMDAARVADLATSLTTEATTRFGQAVLIQDYLRDPSEFDYDTSVSPTSGDAVSAFLDSRAGYCVQFATTMVMMSRTLGIPARLAVGFLPGNAGDGDTYIVQGGDAHAWPELWFPEVGWVRFEPTPSVQTGSAPRYAGNGTNVTPAIPESQAQFPTAAPQQPERPDTGDAPETAGAGDVAGGSAWWWWVAVGVALVVIAAVILAVWRKRRSSDTATLAPAEAAWLGLREALPLEARWPDSLTPHEATSSVERALTELGTPLGRDGTTDLRALGDAVADHRYAPQGCTTAPTTLDAWSRSVAEAASRVSERR
ncbi:transglutaminase-like domain-containing protein [Demequina litorisediminis]|uniref:Transglutaminase-like domain-containing protein n=1 Tax=Demequina litorisediminis TaxID=1849022 RepID=A0ABQ6IGY9_9MICO|nr:transglutaminase domain-containing protein [Demequina litorisediminis]GMA37150.1 hypothetical protein GCM10025876_33540 [Demequina litorisediminis]